MLRRHFSSLPLTRPRIIRLCSSSCLTGINLRLTTTTRQPSKTHNEQTQHQSLPLEGATSSSSSSVSSPPIVEQCPIQFESCCRDVESLLRGTKLRDISSIFEEENIILPSEISTVYDWITASSSLIPSHHRRQPTRGMVDVKYHNLLDKICLKQQQDALEAIATFSSVQERFKTLKSKYKYPYRHQWEFSPLSKKHGAEFLFGSGAQDFRNRFPRVCDVITSDEDKKNLFQIEKLFQRYRSSPDIVLRSKKEVEKFIMNDLPNLSVLCFFFDKYRVNDEIASILNVENGWLGEFGRDIADHIRIRSYRNVRDPDWLLTINRLRMLSETNCFDVLQKREKE